MQVLRPLLIPPSPSLHSGSNALPANVPRAELLRPQSSFWVMGIFLGTSFGPNLAFPWEVGGQGKVCPAPVDTLPGFWRQIGKKGKESEVARLCPTLYDLMYGSLPGSSIHGIF